MLLFVLKPAISKNNAELKAELMQTLKQHSVTERNIVENDENRENTAKFEQAKDSITSNDALTFAVNNVDTYYPDMKEHLDSLIEKFRDQEQKDTVNFLFQEHIFKNISDPKKQVASIIYCIENFVFKGVGINKTFSNTYRISEIVNKEEYANLFAFNK